MKTKDVGERRLIREYVAPWISGVGKRGLLDDAALVPFGDDVLLITTDAGPGRSFLSILGVGTPEDLGHYCATMSLSDIAAMGGVPIAVVAAIMMSEECEATKLRGFVRGLTQACEECGASYVGGDTKEGPELRIVTTAIGKVSGNDVLRRHGAGPNDEVFVSGQIGTVLRNYLLAARAHDQGHHERILRPKARVAFGKELAAESIATACIDMSDGPLAAARELAEANDLIIELDPSALDIAPAPEQAIGDLWRELVLNVGGDYELMFAAPRSRRKEAERLGAIPCGLVKQGGPKVQLTGSNARIEMRPWEHFGHKGWITDAISTIRSALIPACPQNRPPL